MQRLAYKLEEIICNDSGLNFQRVLDNIIFFEKILLLKVFRVKNYHWQDSQSYLWKKNYEVSFLWNILAHTFIQLKFLLSKLAPQKQFWTV